MISGIRYRLGISKAGILAGCLPERNRTNIPQSVLEICTFFLYIWDILHDQAI